MTLNQAKTIEIFLPDGDPKSIKIASITSRTVEATYIPRAKFDEARKHEGLGTVGCYILVGNTEDSSKPEVYIGEAENLINRLNQHNANKDFWNFAIGITSKTRFFTKTHVKFLEWLFYDQAKLANRCLVNNSTIPTKPFVSESMIADLHDNFDTIKILIGAFGVSIFDQLKSQNSVKLIFECKDSKGTYAQGEYNEEGFLVFQGSKFSIAETEGFQKRDGAKATREKLLSDQILIKTENHYELQEDYLFSSPSNASASILGRSSNGWTDWKTKDGKTLDDVYRKSL